MLLVHCLLLVLVDKRLLIKRRLLHILLTMTVLLAHCWAMLLLVMEIFHAVTLTTRQSLLSTRTKHQ